MTYLDRVLYWLNWLLERDRNTRNYYTTKSPDFYHAQFRCAIWEPTGDGVVMYQTPAGACDLFEFTLIDEGDRIDGPEIIAESAVHWFTWRYFSTGQYGDLKNLYQIQWLFPIIHVARVECPACWDNPERNTRRHTEPIGRLIVHLNDGYRWPREKIADWLDTLDIDLTLRREDAEAAKQRAFAEQFGRECVTWGSIFGGQGSGAG